MSTDQTGVPSVVCAWCEREVKCIRVSDGTVIRPLAWLFPYDAINPRIGECGACRADGAVQTALRKSVGARLYTEAEVREHVQARLGAGGKEDVSERCPTCDRPTATADEWEKIPEGEGSHLCWDGPTGLQCRSAEVDWRGKAIRYREALLVALTELMSGTDRGAARALRVVDTALEAD